MESSGPGWGRDRPRPRRSKPPSSRWCDPDLAQLGLGEGVGVSVGLGDGDGVSVGEGDGLGLGGGLGLHELYECSGDGLGLGLGLGEGTPVSVDEPNSCEAVGDASAPGRPNVGSPGRPFEVDPADGEGEGTGEPLAAGPATGPPTASLWACPTLLPAHSCIQIARRSKRVPASFPAPRSSRRPTATRIAPATPRTRPAMLAFALTWGSPRASPPEAKQRGE